MTIELTFTTDSRGNLIMFVIQYQCNFTFNSMSHFDYRIDIHDRFERESRPVCHSVAMCFTFNSISHFDYRIDIHDRFERESRHVCHSVAMCFYI